MNALGRAGARYDGWRLIPALHRPAVIALLVSLAACTITPHEDADAGAEAGPPCDQRVGTYVNHFVEQAGGCGPIADQTGTVTAQPTSVDPGCSGKLTYSASNCDVHEEETCPATQLGAGYLSRVVADTHWTTDGATGSGTLTYTLVDQTGNAACQSTYAVTSKRQ